MGMLDWLAWLYSEHTDLALIAWAGVDFFLTYLTIKAVRFIRRLLSKSPK